MRSCFAITTLLASLAQAAPHFGEQSTVDLNALAQHRGKLWFGTAADIPGTSETTDSAYLNVLRKNFGEMTPANAMKVPSFNSFAIGLF
jgi:endo-1,4-beta-xylanase